MMDTPSSEDASAMYPEGKVAWVDLRSSGYPWWPYKVVKQDDQVGLIAFGDYSYREVNYSKMRLYNSEKVEEMITKGKAKLKKRPKNLQEYCKAIEEAEQYLREKLDDPSFTFPSGCSSTRGEVLKTPLSLLNSSVWTLGSDSASSAGRGWEDTPSSSGETPMGQPHRKVSSAKRKQRNSNLMEVNGQNESESEGAAPSKKPRLEREDGEKRGSKGKSLPKRLIKTSPSAPTDPLLAKRSHRKPAKKQLAKAKSGLKVEGKVQMDPLMSRLSAEPRDEDPTSARGERGSCAGDKRQRKRKTNTKAADSRSSSSESQVDAVKKTLAPLQQTTPPDSTAPSISPLVEASHIPSPMIAANTRPSPFSSNSDMSPEQDSRSSDDEELPSVNLMGEDKIRIHQLNEKDVVWVKFGKYPFWPALISSVKTPKKRKSKAITSVYFFGYTDDKPLSIHDSRKIAPFKQQDEFVMAGHAQPNFDLAVKEAHDFVQDSAEGKFDGCTPKQIMKQFQALRPKSLSFGKDGSGDLSEGEEEEEEEEEDRKSLSASEDEGREGDRSVSSSDYSNSEPEEEMEDDSDSSPYTYDRVVEEIEILKPELEGVVQGTVESAFHTIYTSGSQKDRERLKLQPRGPIKKWPSQKVNQLLENVLMNIAEPLGFRYALNVLLPEALMRVKARVENIPLEQALAEM